MQKEQLYQLLMNKPIPDNKKQHNIKINKVEILEAEDPEEQKQIVKAVVVDRTDENRIDRDDALMRIRRAKKKALEPKSTVETRKPSVIPMKLSGADAVEDDDGDDERLEQFGLDDRDRGAARRMVRRHAPQ